MVLVDHEWADLDIYELIVIRITLLLSYKKTQKRMLTHLPLAHKPKHTHTPTVPLTLEESKSKENG